MSKMQEVRTAPTTAQAKTVTRTLQLIAASDIDPQSVDWAWEHYLPAGSFSLLAGREGLGKSLVSIWLAAQLSRGTLPGVHYGTPKRTIILASEDSWAHVIVPRLIVADADRTKVGYVNVQTIETEDELRLDVDLPKLKQLIESCGDVGLLVFDPVISRLSGKLDTHKDADVRRELHPLVKLADETKVTMLGLIHVNKSPSTDPLNAVMGSRAFVAVSRSVLFVAEDPNDESVRLFGQPKNNLGPKGPTQTFEMKSASRSHDGRDVEAGVIEWTGTDPRSMREIFEDASQATDTTRSQAAEWLKRFLQQHNGVVESSVVKTEGKLEGHGTRTLQRAANRLGVTVVSVGFPAKTYWCLPGKSPTLTHVMTP